MKTTSSTPDAAALQAALKTRLQELTSHPLPWDDLHTELQPDALDQVRSEADRDLTVEVLNEEAHLIAEIRCALQRMDAGTYGICERCDEPIAARRLEAVPWARFCVEHQREMERRAEETGTRV